MVAYTRLSTEKPPLTTLRERLTLGKLAQVQLAVRTKEDELQSMLNYGLSPAKIDQRQFELDALRDLQRNLGNQLEMIAQQNVAARSAPQPAEEEDDTYIGGFRSQRAYFETLQRERSKLRPLSRKDQLFAKATAAKRSRGKSKYKSYAGVNIDADAATFAQHPSWFSHPASVRSYMFAKETLTGIDPCLERKKVRRQVMFAQRTAGIGYRTRHEWKPC